MIIDTSSAKQKDYYTRTKFHNRKIVIIRNMKAILHLFFLLFLAVVSLGQESRSIEMQGGKIHYQLIGEGDPILVINGGPGFSSEGFLPIAREIASFGYTAVLYDQRGTGQSVLETTDSSTITMDLMAKDIELIRKDLGVNNWILFGHSFGGMLANYYASKFPEKVIAMIHSSSGGIDLHLFENARENLHSRLTDEEIDSLSFWRRVVRENETEFNRRKLNGFLASAYVYNKEHTPTVADRLMQGNMELNRLVWNDMIRINYDCKEALKTFDKPVLILQGNQDVIPESLALIADSVFFNSTLFFLDKCGHYGWLDQKKEYLNRIKSFLKEIEKQN